MNARPTPLEIFRAKGIPHRRMEDWKYTDLRQLLDEKAAAMEFHGGVIVTASLSEQIERIVVGIDELPEWAARALRMVPSRGAMETAARASGPAMAFRIHEGVDVAESLDLGFGAQGHSSVVVVLERGAALKLVETNDRDGSDLRNVAITILLEEDAELTHYRETPFSGELVTIETISVVQEKNARYRGRFLQGGAKLSRTEVNVTLAGEGAETELSGVSVLRDGAHADITTRIEHAAPNTTSRQLFKKVAGGKSRAVYQGKITVKEGAIGSDSRQTAKALLLSDHAEADLKPELEILADDVKCAHGAAVGDLDQDSLFYLRSRGIPEDEARALLIHAFLQEVIDGIEDETLGESALKFVDDGLEAAMRAQP